MKIKLILLIFLSLVSTGCETLSDKDAFEQNIQVHYFESVESQAFFFIELENVYLENYKGLHFFVRGYSLSRRKGDTYVDVEPIAYKKLNNVYSPEMVLAMKATISKIESLINKIDTKLYQDRALNYTEPIISETTISNLLELGIKMAPTDQSNLSLHNILVYHDHVKKEHTDSEIKMYITEVEELINRIESEL